MNRIITAKPKVRTLAGTASDSTAKIPGISRKKPSDTTKLATTAKTMLGARANAAQAIEMPTDTWARNRSTWPGPLAMQPGGQRDADQQAGELGRSLEDGGQQAAARSSRL